MNRTNLFGYRAHLSNNDSYAWDGAVSVNCNYAHCGFNQYTSAGFAYDANGNLTSDGSSTYLYDVETAW